MSLKQIGDEMWEFVAAEGGETRLPPDAKSEVDFPAKWRVFGPWSAETTDLRFWVARPLVSADLAELAEIPQELSVDGRTGPGQDVGLSDDTLDFDALFGGHEQGQQAYAMAEVEVAQEADLIIGAGADWWMQWWIDGQPVYDTLETGNLVAPIARTNHCFRQRLQPGKHLLVVRVISGAGWVLCTGAATARDETLSKLALSDRWGILPDLNEIRPPAKVYWQHTMALRTDLCLAEENIELEYQQFIHSGNVGIVLGAQDSGHYYYAYIPQWGQLWRARGFWAAIAKADGSGYIRNLKMQLIPNVPCHSNVWRSLKVERRGQQIQMWVNGVKGPHVVDDTYGPGRVGIAGFSKYRIRNLKIDGQPVDAKPWKEGDYRGQPWYHIEPDLSLGDVQAWIAAPLLKVGDNEVIMAMAIGQASSCHHLTDQNSAIYFYRSTDGGRTWSRYGEPQLRSALPEGSWVVLQPGVIRAICFDPDQKCFYLRDSTDRGQTWGEAVRGELLGDWGRDLFYEGTRNGLFNLVTLRDGRLLAMILHGYEGLEDKIPNYGQGTWGGGVAQPYCSLSADQGLTWSEPVPMDNAALILGEKPDSPNGGFSETAVAQLPSGKIVAVARPFRSPFMWQTESDDGGQSWRQACYAPFSGAGSPQMIATESGYLALIKRGPGVGLHFSADEGVNWDEGTEVDFPASFNGSAIEIEPDVMLVVYPQSMDEIRPSYVRAQRIRLTADGPVPD